MNKELLSGNEALARGAIDAGALLGAGYPGTPSTEILENFVRYPHVTAQWSPNEKVAYETAFAAAVGGARSWVTMKHVGLNVAADPFMNSAYMGCRGGFVVVVADDPGMYSSQDEQDSRHYARMAKLPILEPANAQECYTFIREAFERSEALQTPVIIRTTTSVAHARGLVQTASAVQTPPTAHFERDIKRFVLVPNHARARKADLLDRLTRFTHWYNQPDMLHRHYVRHSRVGIIATGAPALACAEIFDHYDVLKLAGSFPFADTLIRDFAQPFHTLLVLEENDNFLEEHIRSLALECRIIGEKICPKQGELTPEIIHQIKHRFEQTASEPLREMRVSLPPRPPVLCPGCPHRGTYTAIKKAGAIALGDIGCYSLGALAPLSAMDTLLCMGAGASMPHGLLSAKETQPVVGILGDSTFFHSGITGLVDLVYNQGRATIIVVDNRITAMTGHQEHPGSGHTLSGQVAPMLSIEKIAEACGIKRVRIMNPYTIAESTAIIQDEIAADEPSLIISRAPCPLHNRQPVGTGYQIDAEICKNCRLCLKLGCPALESQDHAKPHINPTLCAGCTLCEQVCPVKAIKHCTI